MYIETMILNAIDGYVTNGKVLRLKHTHKKNGSECTNPNKDACLVATRNRDGWRWYCHRCHESGFISDKTMSPADVTARLKSIKERKIRHKEEVEFISLPHDSIWMGTVEAQGKVPWGAFKWFWDVGLNTDDIKNASAYWSPRYQRVILPIYGKTFHQKRLIGWVGREVECKTKEEREEKGIAKYLTQKIEGKDRLLFRIEGEKSDKVVIVEDMLSAIKINKFTQYTTIALLTTHIDNQTIINLKDKKIVIWLDGDMKSKMVDYVTKFSGFGIDIKMKHTAMDPKKYNSLQINNFLSEKFGEKNNLPTAMHCLYCKTTVHRSFVKNGRCSVCDVPFPELQADRSRAAQASIDASGLTWEQ
jgi:hypothetical protein